MITKTINRRQVLRGLGASLSLPLLESFGRAAELEKAPKRMIFLGITFGVCGPNWYPETSGSFGAEPLPPSLKPLEKHRDDFIQLGNLRNHPSTGSHQTLETFLTAADTRRVPEKLFQNDISIDQYAAQKSPQNTRYQSLVLSSPEGERWGRGASLSWDSGGRPIVGLKDPVRIFNHIFGSKEVSREERLAQLKNKRSILDGVHRDLKSFMGTLTSQDKEKMEEYLYSIRRIEQQIASHDKWIATPFPEPTMEQPKRAVAFGSTAEIRLFYDLMVAAMKADVTRIFSYRQATAGILQEIGYPRGAHSLNHGNLDDDHRFRLARDLKQMECLAYLIERLKGEKENDGSTLFDNTLIAYGSSCFKGHILSNMPVILAGGTRTEAHGKYVKFSKETPLADVWLTVLHNYGVQADRFAGSGNLLKELT